MPIRTFFKGVVLHGACGLSEMIRISKFQESFDQTLVI